MKYDYVIVGGGSAACTIASRLSEDPNITVAVIEAGGKANTPFVKIPFAGAFTIPSILHNWSYQTVPQEGLNGRKGYQPRGKVLGGSSAINAMIYTRGQVQDYDDWGHEEWRFDNVLPYFKKSEDNQRLNDAYHGTGGQLAVSDVVSPHEASIAFLDAAKSQGHRANDDFNGATQEGVGLYQVTQRNGQRCSAADAFIKPFVDRSNLTIMYKTRALKLMMKGKCCIGVEVKHKRQRLQVHANKEVILSAGAFGSPQLLLLSGIGPEEELRRHNIPPIHILPGVGENLHDHPDFVLSYISKNPDLIAFTPKGSWNLLKAYFEYRRSRTGLMTTNFAEAGAFLRSDPSLDRPDIQLHFIPGILDDHARKIHLKYGISCHVCVLRPKSRGSLRLQSADPMKAPLIDPAFLTHPDDIDVLLKGYRITRDIVESESLGPYRDKAMYPPEGDDDEAIIRLLRQRTDTIYHPVGSCKMGTDDMSVVDFQLRVHGIEKLRLVDASVMPSVVSANTNAPTIMIAEKAADMIKAS